ncbi:MAG: phosphoglycerate mutase [Arenimonas sp.]
MAGPALMIILLLERRRFAGQPLSSAVAQRLGRGERLPDGEPGERAQLLRQFEILPRDLPMAAITRESDAGDAGEGAWLRADPVHVSADATGARLKAWGTLGLEVQESREFVAALRPLFVEAGMALTAPTPDRWYLSLPRGTTVPDFVDPAQAFGGELLSMLPAGLEGRRWRSLFNESQVVLHQHPRNAARIAAGRLPVNGLWFWGAGVLPDSVRCAAATVLSDDAELMALERLDASPAGGHRAGSLLDLRRQREWAKVEAVLAETQREGLELELDFLDGARWRLGSGQNWRFWRRAPAGLED